MSLILIDHTGHCTCNQACKCVLGKIGSTERCTEKELNDAGFKTAHITEKSLRQILDYLCCDGKTKVLSIKCKTVKR